MKNKAGHSIWFVRRLGFLLSPVSLEGFALLFSGVAVALGLPALGKWLSLHGLDPVLGDVMSVVGFFSIFVTYGVAARHSSAVDPY